MTKTKDLFELYRSKSKGGKDFEDKHVVQTTDDANGNDDEVFKGSKVKPHDRKKTRQGYNKGEDDKVYESFVVVDKGYNILHRHGTIAAANAKAKSKGLDPEKHVMTHQYHRMLKSGEVKEDLELSEDQIIDAINELAEIEGVELDEETFYDLYERIEAVTERSETNIGSAPTRNLRFIRNKVGTFHHDNEKRQLADISKKGKKKKVRESFLDKYVKPSQLSDHERIEESLSYLNTEQREMIKNLYDNVDRLNQAHIMSNIDDEDVVQEMLDIVITNGN